MWFGTVMITISHKHTDIWRNMILAIDSTNFQNGEQTLITSKCHYCTNSGYQCGVGHNVQLCMRHASSTQTAQSMPMVEPSSKKWLRDIPKALQLSLTMYSVGNKPVTAKLFRIHSNTMHISQFFWSPMSAAAIYLRILRADYNSSLWSTTSISRK